jgi:predicted DNA-binding transcriptional regulator AlpA
MGEWSMAKKKTPELRIAGDYFDVPEAAQYMKVAKRTVYQMIYKTKRMTTTKGIQFPLRYMGRKPIFLIEELKQWMDQRTSV